MASSKPVQVELMRELLTRGFGATFARGLASRLPGGEPLPRALRWVKQVLAASLQCVSSGNDIVTKGGVSDTRRADRRRQDDDRRDAFGDGSTFFAVDGFGITFSSGTRSAPAISGAWADGCAAGVTTPACRGPGGAPTSSTRYTGGRGASAREPHHSAAATNARCTVAENAMPRPSVVGLVAERDTLTDRRPVQRRARHP